MTKLEKLLKLREEISLDNEEYCDYIFNHFMKHGKLYIFKIFYYYEENGCVYSDYFTFTLYKGILKHSYKKLLDVISKDNFIVFLTEENKEKIFELYNNIKK